MVCYEVSQKKQRGKRAASPSFADPEKDLCDPMPTVSQKDLGEVFCGLVKNLQPQ